MSRVRRTAALQATAALQNIDILESDGGFSTDDERSIPPINLSETLESHSSSDSSDCDETAFSCVAYTKRGPSGDGQPSSLYGRDCMSSSSKDNCEWKPLEIGKSNDQRRVSAHNIFKETPGPTCHAKNKIVSELDAWRLLVDEKTLRHVFQCTQLHAQEKNELRDFTIEELEKFIGLQYCRGYYGKNHSVDLLWSEKFGVRLFSDVMARNRFVEIKRNLRFDEKQSRSFRLEEDPFTHIRFVFDVIAENCRRMYVPHFSLCIDEQLMPLKTRCKFIVYMPNKPDKFGMKFWILADNKSKYVCNMLPYLGAIERTARGTRSLSNYVVHTLVQHLYNKCYNLTTDNFFTSIQLAYELREKKTSLVGTLRASSKGLPTQLSEKKLDLHKTAFVYNGKENTMIAKYQCKKTKSVYVLSTMHVNPGIDSGIKSKPHVIKFYNTEKCAVDTVDSMLRMTSSRCATRRWPVAVWENLLDIVALNAWILFTEVTGSKISRKDFLLSLIEILTKKQEAPNPKKCVRVDNYPEPTTKRRKCEKVSCRNKASASCASCGMHLCGTHCADSVQKVSLSACEKCVENM